jgi:hypothetical protein
MSSSNHIVIDLTVSPSPTKKRKLPNLARKPPLKFRGVIVDLSTLTDSESDGEEDRGQENSPWTAFFERAAQETNSPRSAILADLREDGKDYSALCDEIEVPFNLEKEDLSFLSTTTSD